MRRSVTMGLLFAAVGMGVVPVWLPGEGGARADVRETKHNLINRPNQKSTEADSKDVCVFCHFPSVGLLDEGFATAQAPRWQRAVPMPHAFSVYDDLGRTGLEGSEPVGSQSVACLACHDSNQAFSVSKLSLDHPFGIPYRGTLAPPSAVDAARRQALQSDKPAKAAESDFFKRSEFRPAFEGLSGGRRIFWASAQDGSYRRGKNDLPLYARKSPLGGEPMPFVECTSCHDPHTTNPLFLRMANTGNKLCMTCHEK